MRLEIVLPHPDKALSPNAARALSPRAAAAQNAVKMRLVKEVRHGACVRARVALNACQQRNFPAEEVDVTWYYKGVRPDFDNVVARCKAIIDGCADAFGINDRVLELGRVRRVHDLGIHAGTVALTFKYGEVRGV